jgi:hypothetical protein
MSVIRPTLENPRGVDDDVEGTGLLEEPLHGVLVGDIDSRCGVWVTEFRGPAVCCVGVEVGDGHPVALGGQCLGRGPADPGRPADYDGAPLAPVVHPVGPSTMK